MAKKTREKKSPMGGGAGGAVAAAKTAKPKPPWARKTERKEAHGNSQRSAATVRRLKMYKQRPIRDKEDFKARVTIEGVTEHENRSRSKMVREYEL